MRWSLAVALATASVSLAALPAQADSSPKDPTDPATPTTVTTDALPTVQIDGVVWSQAIAGNVVYAGGSFTTARPAGSASDENTVPRQNMLAYDIRTGELIPDFAPSFNAQVRTVAVSPDESVVYVGGEFTSVDGVTRNRIAAFDATTGELIDDFAPDINYPVRAIAATDTTVYVGGNFWGVGNQDRGRLAAFRASDGALLDWTPQANSVVWAMTISPDGSKIAVGGQFTELNGSSESGYGLGMLDAVTGKSLPMAINSPDLVYNATADGAITTLTSDSEYIYGGGYTYGKSGGTLEGTFAASWDGGTVHWINDCHGDTYSLHADGDVIYQAGHSHYCENIDGFRQGEGGVGDYPYHRGTAMSRAATGTITWEPDSGARGRYHSFAGQPSPSLLTWFPDFNAGSYTGQSQGPWSVAGNDDYLVMGGEFTRVNGQSQQGLVRFASSGIAPDEEGPRLYGDSYPISVTSSEPGKVRINWRANYDSDNDYLEYRVYRDEEIGENRVETRKVRADFWNLYTMGVTDTGLEPGSTHRYRVKVYDPWGNVANSNWVEVTVATSGTVSDYVRAVLDSEPEHFWRLGESDGTTVRDTIGFEDATAGADVTRGVRGAIGGDTDTASRFDGTPGGYAATSTVENPVDVFTLEAWFRTSSTTGGKIVGWGRQGSNGWPRIPTKFDRQVFMDDGGHLLFGVKPNASRVAIASDLAYNDGRWHQVTASLGPDGMKLYVDGTPVAQKSGVVNGESLSLGSWWIGGGGSSTTFAVAPTSAFFTGDIDDVAVYKKVLSDTEVAAHFAAAGTPEPPENEAPTAVFNPTVKDLTVTVDGSKSFDVDGKVVSYKWDFGDGSKPVSGAKPKAHTYAAAGAYDVTLTVSDGDGATDSATKKVTATVPPPANVAPTAAFTRTVEDLSVSVDGSKSADTDGKIVRYAWDFGDGSEPVKGQSPTASHTYAADGTYRVRLTVTDEDGARDSVTKEVTVTASVTEPPNTAPTARDVRVTTTAGHAVRIRLRADDADGDELTYGFDHLRGAHIRGQGPIVRYLPKRGFVGTTSFRYVATDPSGESDRGRVVVRVRRTESHVGRVRVRPDVVRVGTRARVLVTVRTGGHLARNGVVVIRDGRRWLGRDEVNRHGKARVHIRRMAHGKHRLTVHFRGPTAKHDAKRITVRVHRRS